MSSCSASQHARFAGVDALEGDCPKNGASCTPDGLCVVVDGYGSVPASARPGAGTHAWTKTVGVDPASFTSLACPSSSLCVAGDGAGRIATSVAPAAAHPTWAIGPRLVGLADETRRTKPIHIACGSSRLCVAVDNAGNAVSTAHPAGPANGWKTTAIDAGFAAEDVSCTAGGLCAAVDADDYVATSRAPNGAHAAAWKLTGLDLFVPGNSFPLAFDPLQEVSCASPSLCVAIQQVTGDHDLEVSLDPAATAPTWRPRAIRVRPKDDDPASADALSGISCRSRSLCVAGDPDAHGVVTSTDAGRHWKLTRIAPRDADLDALSCSTASFCVAADDRGHVIATRSPTSGPKAWHATRLSRGHALSAVQCASASLCAGIDGHGRVLVSTRPAGPGSTWKVAPLHMRIADLPCPTTTLCVLITSDGNAIIGQRRG